MIFCDNDVKCASIINHNKSKKHLKIKLKNYKNNIPFINLYKILLFGIFIYFQNLVATLSFSSNTCFQNLVATLSF